MLRTVLSLAALPALVAADAKDDLDAYFSQKAAELDQAAQDQFKSTTEPFTVSIGTADGVFYQYQHIDVKSGPPKAPSYFCQPIHQYSTSKFITAATIARAVETNAGVSWDTKAGDVIDWWTNDPSDPRSNLTLIHFLSQTAGADNTVRDVDKPSACAGSDACWDGCMKYSYANVFCNEPEKSFRYDEINFSFAQYMIMKAINFDGTWVDFLKKYFGEPLGLTYAPPTAKGEDGYMWGVGNLQIPADADTEFCKYFGVHDETMVRGGSGMVMSSTGYSIFMQKYLAGDYIQDRSVMQKVYTKDWNIDVGSSPWHYALGMWAFDEAKDVDYMFHSTGFRNALPIIGKFSGGVDFFIYFNLLEIQG